MLDLARDIIGSQPILTAFLAIGLGYLVGQISIGGFSLGVGAVLFVGLAIGAFAPKAQIIGTDRADRTDHVPVWDRDPLRQAILRRHGRRRAEVQSAGARRMHSQPVRCTRPGTRLRYQDRTYARHLCRINDQHRHPPGCARCHEEQGSVDRLFHRLSLRGHWSDPVHLLHDPDRKAKISGQGATLPHGRNFDRRRLCRKETRRADDGATQRCTGHDGSKGRTQLRSCGRYRPVRRRRHSRGRGAE